MSSDICDKISSFLLQVCVLRLVITTLTVIPTSFAQRGVTPVYHDVAMRRPARNAVYCSFATRGNANSLASMASCVPSEAFA